MNPILRLFNISRVAFSEQKIEEKLTQNRKTKRSRWMLLTFFYEHFVKTLKKPVNRGKPQFSRSFTLTTQFVFIHPLVVLVFWLHFHSFRKKMMIVILKVKDSGGDLC